MAGERSNELQAGIRLRARALERGVAAEGLLHLGFTSS
jgi:hypothetical protein